MDDLNPAQREAVSTSAGPLLVLAGAGTGKTRVVTYRIARLIRRGTPADRILAVTFTNKAAAEMQTRVSALLKRSAKKRPEISTFHSLCVRVLRRHIKRLGYPERFTICDRGDQETHARAALREIKVGEAVLRSRDLLAIISQWKSSGIRPPDAGAAASSDREHLASAAYRRYQDSLKASGSVDFDDLLLCTEELMQNFPDVRRSEADRFQHVMVDEYQDTNECQYRIVRALARGHRNLCVVGDDDQSIYGWRGAEVTHILNFRKDWPDAKVVRLEENYRSTSAILTLANRLIAFNKNRHDKVLRPARHGGEKPRVLQCQDPEDEAETIVEDIVGQLQSPSLDPRDVAILFRTNEQPRVFEQVLRKANLPYVLIGGMSFFDRKEVRDVLAYLRVVENPNDEPSLLRILNNPPRGIGQATVKLLLARAVEEGIPLWKVICNAGHGSNVAPAARSAIQKFVDLIKQFQGRFKNESHAQVTAQLINEIGYYGELARIAKDPSELQSRTAGVEEIINAIGTYEQGSSGASLEGFLDETMLGDRDFDQTKENQLRSNSITLMTLHSAKGLEFPHVYFVGMEEGLLPHRRAVEVEGEAIDEERRLCYVGVTRAQDRLTMSLSRSRRKWGKVHETDPSRFLFEITGRAENPHAKKVSSDSGPPKPARRDGAEPKKRAGRKATPASRQKPNPAGRSPRRQ